MEQHPLEELIGSSSMLDDECVRDLERVVALHAQAQASANCDEPKDLALIEVILATWLFERVNPRDAGTNYDALTSVILDPGHTAQRLALTDEELESVLDSLERSGHLLVEKHPCRSTGSIYVVDFLPLIRTSAEALRNKLDRSWRALQFHQLREIWCEANRGLKWVFAEFARKSPLARRMGELEQAWLDLAGRTSADFEVAIPPSDVEALYAALESLGRIQEEVVALSGAVEPLLSVALAKQAHFRAQHRRQAALACASAKLRLVS